MFDAAPVPLTATHPLLRVAHELLSPVLVALPSPLTERHDMKLTLQEPGEPSAAVPFPVVEALPKPLNDQQPNSARPPHAAVFEASPVPLTARQDSATIRPHVPFPPAATVFEASPSPLIATQLITTPN